MHRYLNVSVDPDPQETAEWLEAFEQVLDEEGPTRATQLLQSLHDKARKSGVDVPIQLNTPYINTIPVEEEVPYPGDRALERRIKSLVRWNALAMVHRQNKHDKGIGGHISTYASLATLLEVGFNHFFHATYGDQPGDFVYFQGHASPGVYARAYLEGRLTEEDLGHFRHELRDHPGLTSYPHPWLMPKFWRFPTVSMGIGPINAIYQARFMRYLENRGVIPATPRKVWAYIGDGESDEPESMGSLTLASREKLDNLIFVVNCNLQRLDGPVRGNGNIVKELEAAYRGAGWNVVKVLWGSDWDILLARDRSGLLQKRLEECVDGEFQAFKAKGGAYIRKEFFGKYPPLLELVSHMTDDQIGRLRRGGHDPQKVYNAYKRAVETVGMPTVILAKTVKGYGLGTVESRNFTHQEKKLKEEDIAQFRVRFDIPERDDQQGDNYFYRPPAESPEMCYLMERRQALGGFMPVRDHPPSKIAAPPLELFADSLAGSGGREASTTMAFVTILRNLLKDPKLGQYITPIIPDEGRTFGMESVIRQVGIYASQGQLYKPHDSDMLLYYKESKSGQLLEEGITEAGSMATFTAAGTAYSNYRVDIIPFYTYYSMFGFQRIGDMVWAFADARGKGFLMGGTAGRTTLAGEGLQHQDGHSHVLASTVPTCRAYDPAYAYEIAVIVQDGIQRMYVDREDGFYYITVYNEDYAQPPMPAGEGVREGIIKGIYCYQHSPIGPATAQLLGSGPILNEALAAQKILAEKYNVAADVWSVTSYNELRKEALAVERWNRLHPAEPERVPYIVRAIEGYGGPIVAASDYMKIVPDQLAPWLGQRLVTLGTDGFGRSENRQHLRRHFEVNAASIAAAALSRLAREGQFEPARATAAFAELGINPDKIDAAVA